MEKTFYAVVKLTVNIREGMSVENAVEELYTETDYHFNRSDNVSILGTELLQISPVKPV